MNRMTLPTLDWPYPNATQVVIWSGVFPDYDERIAAMAQKIKEHSDV